MLFVFLSNPASCININLQRNRHQCSNQKNSANFDIGACLSIRGVKNGQNCLLRYCLLRWMCFIKAYLCHTMLGTCTCQSHLYKK